VIPAFRRTHDQDAGDVALLGGRATTAIPLYDTEFIAEIP
jgi:hypothetical protein